MNLQIHVRTFHRDRWRLTRRLLFGCWYIFKRLQWAAWKQQSPERNRRLRRCRSADFLLLCGLITAESVLLEPRYNTRGQEFVNTHSICILWIAGRDGDESHTFSLSLLLDSRWKRFWVKNVWHGTRRQVTRDNAEVRRRSIILQVMLCVGHVGLRVGVWRACEGWVKGEWRVCEGRVKGVIDAHAFNSVYFIYHKLRIPLREVYNLYTYMSTSLTFDLSSDQEKLPNK